MITGYVAILIIMTNVAIIIMGMGNLRSIDRIQRLESEIAELRHFVDKFD